jgi:hypothetical protein
MYDLFNAWFLSPGAFEHTCVPFDPTKVDVGFV